MRIEGDTFERVKEKGGDMMIRKKQVIVALSIVTIAFLLGTVTLPAEGFWRHYMEIWGAINRIQDELAEKQVKLESVQKEIAENQEKLAEIQDELEDLQDRVSTLEAYACVHSTSSASRDVASWEAMPDMSVQITLTRTSTLVIMFSAMAYAVEGGIMAVRATANGFVAFPPEVSQFTATSLAESSEMARSYAHNFYITLNAGTYTVRIEWKSSVAGKNVWAHERSLIVLALPA